MLLSQRLKNLLQIHDRSSISYTMNKLSTEERTRVVKALLEGNSLRSTTRMTGVHRTTILKLLVELGTVCAEYQDRTLRNLPCKRIQADEIWSFVYAKEKHCSPEMKAAGAGDCWVWVGMDADTKLVVSWLAGTRDAGCAHDFMQDLASRLAHRVQLTTDGHHAYLTAVEGAFDNDIDYARLIKQYGPSVEGVGTAKRYSPPECIGTKTKVVSGDPDAAHISTSYIERQNLTMRMAMRRFTRLTNGFSKKIENHIAQLALHYMFYNFGRIHQTLRITPAMAAGVSDHVWSVEEIIGLLDAA